MKNKKGLSSIVTAVIMIVLSLIAVGVVWTIINNVVESGSEKVSLSSSCLDVKIKATKVICSGTNEGTCDVTLKRESGGKDIEGVKLIFTDEAKENTYVATIVGNIAPLATKTEKLIDTGLVNPIKVEVAPYFFDESDNEQLCPAVNPYEF
jgi:hypothetical protein